jgi:hypothetical protein
MENLSAVGSGSLIIIVVRRHRDSATGVSVRDAAGRSRHP